MNHQNLSIAKELNQLTRRTFKNTEEKFSPEMITLP